MSSDVLDPALSPSTRVPRRRSGATLLSLLASALLLVVLYRSLNVHLIGQALLGADVRWLVISVGMILPITVLRALRFFWVTPRGALPGVAEALRLTLVASALNVFAPAKAGDLAKSYFVSKRSDTTPGVAIAIVVYERLCDLVGIIFWCVLGWLIGRPEVPGATAIFWPLLAVAGVICAVLILSERVALWIRRVVHDGLLPGKLRRLGQLIDGWPGLLGVLGGRRRWILSFSLALWLAHLVQIWMFTVALSVTVPFTICASLSAVALMAGQIPLTFAGLGTRDLALVVLLSRYMAPETAAALGVLISTRGLLPPLLGVPIMRPYVAMALDDARLVQAGSDPQPGV